MVVSVSLILEGCTNGLSSETELLKWLSEPRNGLVKTTSANGFVLTLKYLPPEYLVYMEQKKGGIEIQSKEFDDSMTFIFSIEHQSKYVDASNYRIHNLSQYKSRIAQLNFDIKKYLFIKEGNGDITPPVLSVFENAYEIGDKKSFYLVFPKNIEKKEEMGMVDIVFVDPFLDTGINHFIFNKNAFKQIPKLEFTN